MSQYWCVNFDHLIKGMYNRFFTVKLTMFPFAINHLVVGKCCHLNFDRAGNITVPEIGDINDERKVTVVFVLKLF